MTTLWCDRGLRQILAERFDSLEFGEGKAGLESLDLALGHPWDLVMVAIDLPDREGLNVLTELKAVAPRPVDTRIDSSRGSL
jgi:DNA-binding NarL/FixJ family response regulator